MLRILPLGRIEARDGALVDDEKRDVVDLLDLFAGQDVSGEPEVRLGHEHEVLGDADRLVAALDLVVAGAVAVHSDDVQARDARGLGRLDHAGCSVVPMDEHALDIVAVLHDVIFHDGLRLVGRPLLAGLVVEDLDIRTLDPLGAVESIVSLDLGVVTRLAADLHDLGAVREVPS